jgi:hypothetical protein
MSATCVRPVSDFRETVHDALSRAYGRLRHGAERLARDAESTPRAAENWLDGACTPNSEKLFNIMKRNAALRAELLALLSEAE